MCLITGARVVPNVSEVWRLHIVQVRTRVSFLHLIRLLDVVNLAFIQKPLLSWRQCIVVTASVSHTTSDAAEIVVLLENRPGIGRALRRVCQL